MRVTTLMYHVALLFRAVRWSRCYKEPREKTAKGGQCTYQLDEATETTGAIQSQSIWSTNADTGRQSVKCRNAAVLLATPAADWHRLNEPVSASVHNAAAVRRLQPRTVIHSQRLDDSSAVRRNWHAADAHSLRIKISPPQNVLF